MIFDSLLGNEPIKAYLRKAIQANRLPHALLFAGPSGVGKSLFAKHLASFLLNTTLHRIEGETHPDFHPLRPDSKSGLHSIDSLRALIDEVHSSSFERSGKVFLIYDAERMQTASANALLKTLEEPNPDTTLILLTEHQNEILSTIRSRCSSLIFQRISEKEVFSFLQEKGYPGHVAKMAHGSLGKAVELAEKPRLEKSIFSLLAQRLSYPKLLQEMEKIEALVEDEDPVKKNQKADRLFSACLFWVRDQQARREGLGPEALFFPEEEAVSFPLPTLQTMLHKVEQARTCYQRNIRLLTCLEAVLSIL